MQIGILEHNNFSSEAISILKKIGSVNLFNPEKQNLNKFLADKEIIFVRLNYMLNEDVLNVAPKLKYICSPTTGLNHIDTPFCKKRNIKIVSLKGEKAFLRNIRATPEHTLGLILALFRNYKNAFLSKSNRDWNRDLYRGYEVYNHSFGIIGYGRVGKIVAKYLLNMGARISIFDINRVQSKNNKVTIQRDINTLIKNSDTIILSASYSDDAPFVIGKKQLDLMKGKYFVNTSRGELVDEADLINKLKQNFFKGVAMDVLANENNANNNLNTFLALESSNNLIITPHIGGATYTSMANTEIFIANKLSKALNLFN
jgi:D-3-phosphoglycerate dehydrogenase